MRLLVLILLLVPLPAFAQQPTVRLESKVTGNRELPRVTYILPWRQPAELDFGWQPEPGIAGELFRQLRRDEYLRQLNYQQRLAENAVDSPSPVPDNQE